MSSLAVQEHDTYIDVEISGALTIYNVPSFFKESVAPLSTSKSIILDLSKIEEIDTAGIQVLLMLTRHASEEGQGCEVSEISEPLKEYLETFNLVGQFPLSGLILA